MPKYQVMRVISRSEAKAKGVKRYFTGKPCKKRHISERYVSNTQCCRCRQTWSEHFNRSDKGKAFVEAYVRSEKGEAARRQARRRFEQSEKGKLSAANCRKRNGTRLAAKRRATKLHATPKWANHETIKEFYEVAALMTRITGEQYDVDHIISLQGENFCGLHCEDNLQVMTHAENIRKNNRLPDNMC